MNYLEFEKVFNDEIKKNNINEKIDTKKFYDYMKLLLEWNKKINLTAITDEKEFIVKHFVDSLTINDFIKEDGKIIDVGTGAGFPGIPIKICRKNADITLIDSSNKKINVLNDIILKLNLEKIETIHVRAEDLANDTKYREIFDIAISRAVSNMPTLVEYLLPFVKLDGMAICMKGPNFEEELEESKKAIKTLGGKIEKIHTINIDGNIERNIVILRKIRNTPEKYPRRQGKPLKNPIK